MASATTIANFIEEIASKAQYAYKTLGKVKPSICIGMACVESAYGTSKIMRNHNAFFGQKVGTGKTAKKYWPGTFFTSKTKEEYTLGQHTVIVDAFRSYPDMQTCVLNFYELLNTGLYSRVKADADYKTQMKQIKACGYMTSSTEVNSVLTLIDRYNLTKYDGICENGEGSAGNPYQLTKRIIKLDDRGESVKWVQRQLNLHGANLKEDGIFGKQTKLAVLLYQKDHGLTQDGIVGPKTIAALQN